MNAESIQAEGWDVQPVEPEVETVETSTDNELRSDLEQAHKTLRRIANINPALIPGGPSNQNFGKKVVVALEKAKRLAKDEMVAQIRRETIREIDTYGDESSATAEPHNH